MTTGRRSRQSIQQRNAHLESLIALGRVVHGNRAPEIARCYVVLTGIAADQVEVLRIDA
ncbi:MAG: hypothetical protein JWP01_3357 [Myxococcales bacterium]|nr:hypothetical protein [Myxococcales bacterium]